MAFQWRSVRLKQCYVSKLPYKNSRSVISMFLTFFNIFHVKNIEFTDLELCLIGFPS
jgi:hypothetical protein